MSQQIWSTINPDTTSGTMLAALLVDFKDALVTGYAGLSRPANLQAGGMWIDTTNQGASTYYWAFKLWTGTVDIEIFRININSNFGGALTCDAIFEVDQISADTAGAVQELIKQRILTNGQALSGDTIGEIQFVGRTNTSTDPIVGYIKYVSTDDETTTAYGGYLSFYSTPDASATVSEHLRFISGLVETPEPQLLNSLRLVPQNIATTATIVQLSAANVLVEFTGSTATAVQGINSGHDSQEIKIHNRSSAIVTLKHQNTSAAAADRIQLPGSADMVIQPEESITLYYCITDTRWKVKANKLKQFTRTVSVLLANVSTWTAPTGCTRVRLVSTSSPKKSFGEGGLINVYGNCYAMGDNANGQLGVGDVTSRSSPVQVATARFRVISSGPISTVGVFPALVGITASTPGVVTGAAYAWGLNTHGNLGVGDVVPRSSPIAVLGGLKFASVESGTSNVIALTPGGVAYAWGQNNNGQLGVGNTASRSSPVAVLGGLKFIKLYNGNMWDATNPAGFSMGLTSAGAAYAWGVNTNGNLGVGDVTPRSSPVAVVGGLTFAKLAVGGIPGASHTHFAMGLTAAGALYAWGANTNGQLGVGDVTPRSSPVAVLGGLTFVDCGFASEVGSAWGLTSSGALYMWGQNSAGYLGVGDTTPRSSPVAVLGGLSFSKVRIMGGAAYGMTADGTLYSWGQDANGGLGLGATTNTSSPSAVLGSLKFIDFDVVPRTSTAHMPFATSVNGATYAWGYNFFGNLGLADTTDRSSPVAIVSNGHAMDVRNFVSEITTNVTAGQSYNVVLGDTESYFGNVPLGMGVSKLTIEYDI